MSPSVKTNIWLYARVCYVLHKNTPTSQSHTLKTRQTGGKNTKKRIRMITISISHKTTQKFVLSSMLLSKLVTHEIYCSLHVNRNAQIIHTSHAMLQLMRQSRKKLNPKRKKRTRNKIKRTDEFHAKIDDDQYLLASRAWSISDLLAQ